MNTISPPAPGERDVFSGDPAALNLSGSMQYLCIDHGHLSTSHLALNIDLNSREVESRRGHNMVWIKGGIDEVIDFYIKDKRLKMEAIDRTVCHIEISIP